MPRLQRRPLRVAYDDPVMASAMGWSQSRHPAPLAAAPRLQGGPGRVRAHRMARRGWRCRRASARAGAVAAATSAAGSSGSVMGPPTSSAWRWARRRPIEP